MDAMIHAMTRLLGPLKRRVLQRTRRLRRRWKVVGAIAGLVVLRHDGVRCVLHTVSYRGVAAM